VPNGIVAFGGYNLEAAIAAANKIPFEGTQAFAANLIGSVASAFHSQNFYATATREQLKHIRRWRWIVKAVIRWPTSCN
jgi:hypothetical protein